MVAKTSSCPSVVGPLSHYSWDHLGNHFYPNTRGSLSTFRPVWLKKLADHFECVVFICVCSASISAIDVYCCRCDISVGWQSLCTGDCPKVWGADPVRQTIC